MQGAPAQQAVHQHHHETVGDEARDPDYDHAADDEFDALIGLSAKKEASESATQETKIPEA